MPDSPEVKRQRSYAYNQALKLLKERHRAEWREIYERVWHEVSAEPVPRTRRNLGWHKVGEEDDGLVR
jgi:hypothetical protein